MNKINYLLPLLLLVFASCEETKEAGKYDNWQARSVAFIDSIAGVYNAQTDATPEAERLYAYTDLVTQQSIYVKKHPREGVVLGESPLYTSTISAFYRMYYANNKEIVQQNYLGEWPGDTSTASTFSLNGVITGWAYTLQHMKVGERWTLYIPYSSGYGASTGQDGSLQAYSTLIYDVQLESIVNMR